jgi:hypothetical protein
MSEPGEMPNLVHDHRAVPAWVIYPQVRGLVTDQHPAAAIGGHLHRAYPELVSGHLGVSTRNGHWATRHLDAALPPELGGNSESDREFHEPTVQVG